MSKDFDVCLFVELVRYLIFLPILILVLLVLFGDNFAHISKIEKWGWNGLAIWFFIFIGMSIGGIVATDFEVRRPSSTEICEHLSQSGFGSPILIGAVIGLLISLAVLIYLKRKIRNSKSD